MPPIQSSPGFHASTLAGIIDLFAAQYSAIFEYQNSDPIVQSTNGPYLDYIDPHTGEQSCPSFSDPWEDTLEALNTIMFRIGVHAGQKHHPSELKAFMDPGLESKTAVPGTRVGNHNIFRTNYWFFLGAALVEILCIAFIVPV